MNNSALNPSRVQGTVAPGFESVRRTYEHDMQTLAEKNTQLCVYYKGRIVVDLWASVSASTESEKGTSTSGADAPVFSPDSLVNVFSSGKSLESIAMASLVGRGLLEYEAKISDYWPEFAANGKGELTVAELMRHEGGLAAFDTSIDAEDLFVESIKQNKVGEIIERHSLRFRKGKGGRREYHAITRGWIVNEIFRRVDPAGRTVGEFLEEEISGPLDAHAIIGVKQGDLGRISKVSPLGIGFQLLESLKPRRLGRRIKHSFFQILGRLIKLLPSLLRGTTRGAPPPYEGMDGIGFFNESAVAMGETPSAAANCSARGLAKIAAMMSARGKWADREFLSEEAWQAMHDDPVEGDIGFGLTHFTRGGVNLFTEVHPKSSRLERDFNVGREGFYGWMGLGGSIFQWHPRHEIGFGFVPTSLHVLDFLNERGKAYQAEVLRCVERLDP